jgi:hypothetical protein
MNHSLDIIVKAVKFAFNVQTQVYGKGRKIRVKQALASILYYSQEYLDRNEQTESFNDYLRAAITVYPEEKSMTRLEFSLFFGRLSACHSG